MSRMYRANVSVEKPTSGREWAIADALMNFWGVRGSVNLFRRCFPRQFSRPVQKGHMLIRPDDVSRDLTVAGSRIPDCAG